MWGILKAISYGIFFDLNKLKPITMKRLLLALCFISIMGAKAQEKYGNTLNLGVGVSYYGYYFGAPAVNLNYEFDVFRNFTLAPSISAATYRSYNYWGDVRNPYRDYYYRETFVPVGVKGCYYFDELFNAGDKWDFYAGATVGFTFRTVTWENGYNGDHYARHYATPLFGALHIGSEVHLNSKVGLFLDVSTGFSTFGLGLHF